MASFFFTAEEYSIVYIYRFHFSFSDRPSLSGLSWTHSTALLGSNPPPSFPRISKIRVLCHQDWLSTFLYPITHWWVSRLTIMYRAAPNMGMQVPPLCSGSESLDIYPRVSRHSLLRGSHRKRWETVYWLAYIEAVLHCLGRWFLIKMGVHLIIWVEFAFKTLFTYVHSGKWSVTLFWMWLYVFYFQPGMSLEGFFLVLPFCE